MIQEVKPQVNSTITVYLPCSGFFSEVIDPELMIYHPGENVSCSNSTIHNFMSTVYAL